MTGTGLSILQFWDHRLCYATRICDFQPTEQFLLLSGLEEFPRESPQFYRAESRESTNRNRCRGRLREYLEALHPSILNGFLSCQTS